MAGDAQWPAYVGWGLTGFGWMLVSYQANKRDVRKEKRTEVDACCEMAAELLVKARLFYSKAASATESGETADLRFSVHRLLKRLQRLQRQHSRFSLKTPGSELLEAITGDDFESKSRVALAPNHPRLGKMEESVHFVIDALESGFEAEFLSLSQRIGNWWRDRQRWNRWHFLGRDWG